LPLDQLSGARVDSAPVEVGYLAEPLSRPASDLAPLLEAALARGITRVVVPARQPRQARSHTLGLLSYDEVCWGGQFRLANTSGARPISELSTLEDLIRSGAAIDPTARR
jgi:hypothetical protein